MITKYNTYIKESIDESILLSIKYSENTYNYVAILSSDLILDYKVELNNIIQLYAKILIIDNNHIVFEFNKHDYYRYFLYYFSYVYSFNPDDAINFNNIYINLRNLNNKTFMLMFKNIFKLIDENKFDIIIEEYIQKNNKIDKFLYNILSDEQKDKFKYIINANNFDLL